MGACVSTSRSTCSSKSNGEPVPPPCLGIGFCGQKRTKRTFSDHLVTLQHLPSIPNRVFTNGKSRTSCIFTQQGRKGINQDAMIVWEDFMSEDVTFCGVFDGHGPHGHLVARKVRDALPVKLQSFLNSCQSRQNGPGQTCFMGNSKKSDVGDLDKDGSVEDKLNSLWRETFLKSYKAMDKELKSHPNLDCFCSGSTAITIVKQGSNLFMGYIGDSRAIMGSKDSNDSMVAVQLTVDLKPDLPREAERIKRCKGRVFALQDEPEVPRVWLPFDDAPESDYDEQGFSSATLDQSNHSGNAAESDDGQKSEPCLQRNFTVRSAEENDTYGRLAVEVDGDGETVSADDQSWSGLEGVTRVNSLVQLPRFSEERPDP
ncbi:hypothetical protein D5086_025078 [Populus alba]|uniref:Uncharacterized protein n=1 Tax=Populus alba TaxID=43335 RepID=A0ACC4B7Z4_POPAL